MKILSRKAQELNQWRSLNRRKRGAIDWAIIQGSELSFELGKMGSPVRETCTEVVSILCVGSRMIDSDETKPLGGRVSMKGQIEFLTERIEIRNRFMEMAKRKAESLFLKLQEGKPIVAGDERVMHMAQEIKECLARGIVARFGDLEISNLELGRQGWAR